MLWRASPNQIARFATIRTFAFVSPVEKPKHDAWGRLDLALLLMWFGAAAVALAIKHSQLFIGLDGGYMRDIARRQFEWGVPVLSTTIDFFQGVGDVTFAAMNFTMIPSFIVGSWFGVTAAAKVALYSVALIELTLAIIIFARTLGVGRTQAFAAAVILPLLAFPIYQSGALYPALALSPQLASFIAASLVISAAYLKFGQQSAGRDWPYAVIFLGLLLWFVHAGILILMLAGPSFVITGLAGFFAAKDGRERRDKLALLVVTVVALAAPFAYLLGLVLNTAPITAPIELANDRASLEYASVLFHWRTYGAAGPILVISAVLGALLTSFNRSNPLLRIFAITLLSYFTARMCFWIATMVFDFWRGPSASTSSSSSTRFTPCSRCSSSPTSPDWRPFPRSNGSPSTGSAQLRWRRRASWPFSPLPSRGLRATASLIHRPPPSSRCCSNPKLQ